MSVENLFDVVFKGKFAKELDKNRAILHFSKVFKLSVEKSEKYFDGNFRVLKKSQELEKANSFREALKKAGLKVSLVKKFNKNFRAKLTISAAGVILVDPPEIVPANIPTSHFSLDEVGVQFAQVKQALPVKFDISSFVIDEVGAQMVEKQDIPEPQFDVANITLDELGAIFDEPQELIEPEFDLSALSLEEAGSTIVEKKKIPRVQYNTDNIELVD